jgi:hypothetical protein
MFQTEVLEKINTRVLCSLIFFRKSRVLWGNVEKYGTVRQATDDNMMCRKGAVGMPDNLPDKGYRHTHTYNTFAFPLQQWLRERVTALRYNTMPDLFRRYYERAVAFPFSFSPCF